MSLNYFQQELRKLFQRDHPDAVFTGRNCYIPLGSDTRAKIRFDTGLMSNHYDRLTVSIVDRREGQIDRVALLFKDLWGIKGVNNPNFRNGVSPHIWVDGDTAQWYAYQPSQQDLQEVRDTVSEYIALFREPIQEQRPTGQEIRL